MHVIKASVCAQCFVGRRKLTGAHSIRADGTLAVPVNNIVKASCESRRKWAGILFWGSEWQGEVYTLLLNSGNCLVGKKEPGQLSDIYMWVYTFIVIIVIAINITNYNRVVTWWQWSLYWYGQKNWEYTGWPRSHRKPTNKENSTKFCGCGKSRVHYLGHCCQTTILHCTVCCVVQCKHILSLWCVLSGCTVTSRPHCT
jgi:hypothetical protein